VGNVAPAPSRIAVDFVPGFSLRRKTCWQPQVDTRPISIQPFLRSARLDYGSMVGGLATGSARRPRSTVCA
jgi:hypothetical protein